MNYQLWIINYELSIMNYHLWIINYELWIVNYELWIILLLRLTAQCARAQNSSRIAPMRRILSFSRIFFLRFTWSWIFLRIVFAPVRRGLPIAREVRRLRKIRYNRSTVKAHRNPIKTIIHKQDPWKNKSVASVLSVIDFERDERAKGEGADL